MSSSELNATLELVMATMIKANTEAIDGISETLGLIAETQQPDNSFLCLSILTAARVIQLGIAGKHTEASDLHAGMMSRFASFTEDALKCEGIQARS